MATAYETGSDYESQAESQRAFQQLKTRLHRQMIDAMDLSKAGQLPEHELRKQLRALASHLCEMHSSYLPESEREQMVNEIMENLGNVQPSDEVRRLYGGPGRREALLSRGVGFAAVWG